MLLPASSSCSALAKNNKPLAAGTCCDTRQPDGGSCHAGFEVVLPAVSLLLFHSSTNKEFLYVLPESHCRYGW